jgi:hypothetical protein
MSIDLQAVGGPIGPLHRTPAWHGRQRQPLMLQVLECHNRENGFSDGLRLLVSRGAASSFDALVRELVNLFFFAGCLLLNGTEIN